MSGDTEKAAFMQKTLGYGLTGDTRYECMFFYYGATANVIFKTLDYAH